MSLYIIGIDILIVREPRVIAAKGDYVYFRRSIIFVGSRSSNHSSSIERNYKIR